MVRGVTRQRASGCRAMVPVAEQGASTSTAASGAGVVHDRAGGDRGEAAGEGVGGVLDHKGALRISRELHGKRETGNGIGARDAQAGTIGRIFYTKARLPELHCERLDR